MPIDPDHLSSSSWHLRDPLPRIYLTIPLLPVRDLSDRRHSLAPVEHVAEEADASERHPPLQDRPRDRRDLRILSVTSLTAQNSPR
jgi:hypothetical protein